VAQIDSARKRASQFSLALCVLAEKGAFNMLAICTDIEFATVSDAVEISELSRKYIEYDLRRVYTPSRIRYLMRNTSVTSVIWLALALCLIGRIVRT